MRITGLLTLSYNWHEKHKSRDELRPPVSWATKETEDPEEPEPCNHDWKEIGREGVGYSGGDPTGGGLGEYWYSVSYEFAPLYFSDSRAIADRIQNGPEAKPSLNIPHHPTTARIARSGEISFRSPGDAVGSAEKDIGVVPKLD